MLTFTSPPVATARYLRAAFSGQALHITYAGACPGADHESIDARLRPSDLLDAFVEHGIVLGAQPNCFDALVPLDRRRFYSLPGGVPDARSRRARLPSRSHRARGRRRRARAHAASHRSGPRTHRSRPLARLRLRRRGRARRTRKRTLGPVDARASARAAARPRSSVHVDVSQTLVEACALHAIATKRPRSSRCISLPIRRSASAWSRSSTRPRCAKRCAERADERRHRRDVAIRRAPSRNAGRDSVATESTADVEVAAPLVVATGRRARSRSTAAPREREWRDGAARIARGAARALARIATRKARRQPKIERGRRDRSMELRDGLVRTPVRTPRSLAIPSPDLPRPVPPPPARRRPRTLLEM